MFSSYVLPIAISFTFLATCCHAGPPAFSWRFDSNFVSTSLLECQKLDVVVTSLNNDSVSFGVPPYYLMAMEVNGIPTTEFVGEDMTDLNWVVRHAAGATLMLGMVDSNGSGGGVSPNIYTVIPGTDKSCLPPAPTSNFTVSANVTTTLTTCQPWGLAISGGAKPYTVTLAALDSPIVTNVTLGPADDFFTFIDRANSGSQLIAAISDATGIFARGTPLVRTTGSNDVSCTGLVSSSGDAAEIQAAQRAAERSRRARKRTGTIVAACVTSTSLLLIAVGVATCLCIRRRKLASIRLGGQDLVARQFQESSPSAILGPLHLKAGLTLYSQSPITQLSSTAKLSPAETVRHDAFCPPDCDCRPRRYLSERHYPSQFPSKRHQGGNSPSHSTARYMMANEEFIRTVHSAGEVRRTATTTRQRGQLPTRSRNTDRLQPLRVDTDVQPDIIIQHRDGGSAIVQEIPPPYPNRSSRNS